MSHASGRLKTTMTMTAVLLNLALGAAVGEAARVTSVELPNGDEVPRDAGGSFVPDPNTVYTVKFAADPGDPPIRDIHILVGLGAVVKGAQNPPFHVYIDKGSFDSLHYDPDSTRYASLVIGPPGLATGQFKIQVTDYPAVTDPIFTDDGEADEDPRGNTIPVGPGSKTIPVRLDPAEAPAAGTWGLLAIAAGVLGAGAFFILRNGRLA